MRGFPCIQFEITQIYVGSALGLAFWQFLGIVDLVFLAALLQDINMRLHCLKAQQSIFVY